MSMPTSSASPTADDPTTPSGDRAVDDSLGWQTAPIRNFRTFVAYFTTMRIGWIFKTESVIMPAFLDALGANGLARGLLPVASRAGNCLPQVMLAQELKHRSRLKGVLAFLELLRAGPWLAMGAALCLASTVGGTLWISLFLLAYSFFWIANGMVILTYGTLQGKIIRPQWRGRLLAYATTLGGSLAITAALVWMLPILSVDAAPEAFGIIFLTVGFFFLGCAGISLVFAEPTVPVKKRTHSLFVGFGKALGVMKSDVRFRQLLVVSTLYSLLHMLFPHFASYGYKKLPTLGPEALAAWVVIQNFGGIIGGLIFGPWADKYGNRLALSRILMVLATIPLITVMLGTILPWFGPSAWIPWVYTFVFFMIGFAPISQRLLQNYVLELAPPDQQAQYLSTFNLWYIVPLFLSPIIGLLIDMVGFEFTFFVGAISLTFASFAARFLTEPREEREA